jgi:hypothetical protein
VDIWPSVLLSFRHFQQSVRQFCSANLQFFNSSHKLPTKSSPTNSFPHSYVKQLIKYTKHCWPLGQTFYKCYFSCSVVRKCSSWIRGGHAPTLYFAGFGRFRLGTQEGIILFQTGALRPYVQWVMYSYEIAH